MKIKLLFLLTTILLLNGCYIGKGQTIEQKLQNVLDNEIHKYNARGVSASVVFPDGSIWSGTSGISHDTVTVKPDMLFAIGSVTKNFVAVLTLKLVEENILSLEDPLSLWLPDYPYIDNKITIRQLLNHTSGIYMFWDNQELWDELIKDRTRVWTPEEVLAYIKEPYFAPGEGWRYSNTNYLLMAMIIEKATGSTLLTELRKLLWEPAGIENMYLSQEELIPDNMAHIYGDNFVFGNEESDLTYEPRASHESITFGSSGIFTTPESLALWTDLLFKGKLLQEKSMEEMLQFVKFPPVSNMRAYGLGVEQYTTMFSFGKNAIGHGGGNIGSTTYMVYLPDYKTSIAVMINAYPDKSIDVITRWIINLVAREYK